MELLVEAADGVVRDGAGVVWAVSGGATLLSGGGVAVAAGRCVVRSGFLPLEDDPTQPDPRTWGPLGWAALERAVRTALGDGGSGRLVIRPSWMDVISDAPSCVRFLGLRTQWAGEQGFARLGVLLDPTAMLAPSMMGNAADHVRRILEIVAEQPGVDAVATGGPVNLEMYRKLVPPGMPLVVDQQRKAVETAGEE